MIEQLITVKPLLDKKVFNAQESKLIFATYSLIIEQETKVTNCPSCVQTVISRLKKECRNAGI